nr:uncharacterized protein LOC109176682 [Ipomoea batatas]
MQLQGTKVVSLMNVQKTDWDHEILEDLFNESDKEYICNIPISTTTHDDKIIWTGEDKGTYMVKSGYRILRGEVEPSNNLFWTNVGKTHTPPKIKSFIWQACSGLLSTVDNLHIKRIGCSPVYWIAGQMKTLDDYFVCLLLTICWKIWEAQNQKLWRNIRTDPRTTTEDAISFLHAWRNIHPDSYIRSQVRTPTRWEKPRTWVDTTPAFFSDVLASDLN